MRLLPFLMAFTVLFLSPLQSRAEILVKPGESIAFWATRSPTSAPT
jgi:hypothetical protein